MISNIMSFNIFCQNRKHWYCNGERKGHNNLLTIDEYQKYWIKIVKTNQTRLKLLDQSG